MSSLCCSVTWNILLSSKCSRSTWADFNSAGLNTSSIIKIPCSLNLSIAAALIMGTFFLASPVEESRFSQWAAAVSGDSRIAEWDIGVIKNMADANVPNAHNWEATLNWAAYVILKGLVRYTDQWLATDQGAPTVADEDLMINGFMKWFDNPPQ